MNLHDDVVTLAKECGLDDHEGRVNNRVGMALEKFIKLTSREQYASQVAGIVSESIALRSQVAELQRQLDEAAKQEPVAFLVNYYEETKGGGKRNVTQASLEPHEPSIMLQFEPDIAERKLIKTEPLYALPLNLPAMIEQAVREEKEAALKPLRTAVMALASAAENNPMYQSAYKEVDAAIRAMAETK